MVYLLPFMKPLKPCVETVSNPHEPFLHTDEKMVLPDPIREFLVSALIVAVLLLFVGLFGMKAVPILFFAFMLFIFAVIVQAFWNS